MRCTLLLIEFTVISCIPACCDDWLCQENNFYIFQAWPPVDGGIRLMLVLDALFNFHDLLLIDNNQTIDLIEC